MHALLFESHGTLYKYCTPAMGSIGAVLGRLNPFAYRHAGDKGLDEQITYNEAKDTQISTADAKDHPPPAQATGILLEHGDGDLPQHLLPRDRAARLYQETRKSYADLLRSRHSALKTHAEVQISLRRYLQLRSSVRDSQRELCQALKIAQAEGSWARLSDQLCEKSELLEADFGTLEAHVARLQTCQGRLANLEFTVRERENDLFSALESLARAIGVINEPDYGETWFMEGIDGKSRSTESTHLNPLLETYYDKAGDAGLLRDMLVGLDYDYLEAKARRNILLLDQDRALSCSDSHIDQEYRHQRAGIVDELEAATREAEEAKKSCLDAGLQPEPSQCSLPERDLVAKESRAAL
ncbi:uncharacterized protein MYCFIDRAFT_82869 [Pseudocercospora fijiensis CIRAD86]|uniref:Uncharacterized protein n=1 Tax=Pseudocercospora fijiensis (strain CIRAD86) TaxID=383855 RepID=M3A0W7_PSEFD|nr:uncharacterized protein MYCFIDRAFT_82869 [Pseudocercospora fijiensis CIRAD86]EME84779.1 hypothetical protein MYCFIDRAFT_82869 [Pseudocercospora fijiensis CIRAD86]